MIGAGCIWPSEASVSPVAYVVKCYVFFINAVHEFGHILEPGISHDNDMLFTDRLN